MILNVEKNSTNGLQLVPYASKGLHIPFLSQEEYDNLTDAQQTDGTFRIIYDDPETPITASDIPTESVSGVDNVEDGLKKLTKILLWENPDLTQSFTSSTVELLDNASNYKEIEAIYAVGTSSTRQLIVGYSRAISGSARAVANRLSLNTNIVEEFGRVCDVNGRTATFSNCIGVILNTSTGVNSQETNNSLLIPVAIYGYNTLDI